MISLVAKYGIEAKLVGRVEKSSTKELLLKGSFGEIKY